MQKTYVCLYQEHVNDIPALLEKAHMNCYDAIVTPIVNPLFYREFDYEPSKSKHIAFSRSDLILESNNWLQKFVVVLNDSIDCDSDDYNVRRHSEYTLKQEISFAEHVIQQGYMMIKLKSSKCINLATVVSRFIKGIVVVNVPIIDPKTQTQIWRKDRTEDELNSIGEDTWDWWNRFRLASDFHPKIKVALEFSDDVPTNDLVQRWLGEPVEYIILPSNIFKKNKCNYPVLSKGHQEVLSHFMINNVQFIIKANCKDECVRYYAEYVKHLVEKTKIDPMQGYDDVIQIPLQPLYDNLDCYTYEVFEKDPVKYKLYQEAIELALIDKVPESKIDEKTIIIMILGAGRGPLVRSALNASVNTKRKIKIYIIEKNPNAIITLMALVEELWSDKDIQIFPQDMRDFTPPEKADILVSELLGSFGDNELSPECLDGAQKHLKKGGISIPCKSTSYINPIMSSKIYNSIRQSYPDRFSSDAKTYNSVNSSENTFVIYFKNIYHISKPKILFEFYHPNKCRVIDNSRYKTLQFEVKKNCILHGLAGYFDAILYKDIIMSIHPETHSKGLFSWFSMYFPFSEPQQLKAGDIIEVNFWRCVSTHRVWYEWSTSSPYVTRIHNQDGKNCAMLK